MARKADKAEAPATLEQTSEVQEKLPEEVSTSEVQLDTLTLDEYLAKVPVNPGLVASFKYEGSTRFPETLEPKTMDEWKTAFEVQSARIYE